MQRTYSSWESMDKIHRSFFCLAWFHALVSERRMFIPQGWTKYYEFNETDINAATTSLTKIITSGRLLRLYIFLFQFFYNLKV